MNVVTGEVSFVAVRVNDAHSEPVTLVQAAPAVVSGTYEYTLAPAVALSVCTVGAFGSAKAATSKPLRLSVRNVASFMFASVG